MSAANEQRQARETGQETRIATLIEPAINDLGYLLVRVRVLSTNGCTLQIMAEDEDGNFNISDCEKLSQEITPLLDVEDPIDRAYHLEVSSPGIDRPLVRLRDFERWIGHEARIELATMIDGRKRFRGDLVAVKDAQVVLHLPDVPEGADPEVTLPFAQIADAKLMMTDKLLAQAAAQQAEADPIDQTDIETIEISPQEIN